MIDPQTGNIHISDKIIIKPNDLLEDVKNFKIGEKQIIDGIHSDWVWLRERNVKIGNEFFIISFCFYKYKLKTLTFVVSDKPYSLEYSDWSKWSLEEELFNAKRYDNWLSKKLGSNREFNWGSVWASYDDKGGGSSAGIKYKEYTSA